eukprot:TRINITY_DN51885_c0_g1_i1.p1 TRINITY_DN51885_c0_g1~~TRINITY_DN51885_c0_g1_i1.p1  ORF type:complete len:162 (-),score=48.61 TRINITY_DN51885_c0_g1_i1:209-694(-)
MGEEENEQDPNQVSLANASPQQLNVVKQQLEQEIKSLMNNLGALQDASMRFENSMDTIKSLCPENQDKPMLIPLTSSLYIDGVMTNTKTVTVDVGTGYFIEMSVEKANKFCNRRMNLLKDNCNKVEKVIKDKRKNLDTITMVFQQKMMRMREAEEAAKQGS